MNAPTERQRRRNRAMLLVIVAIFFVPMIIAGIMRFADISPEANRQKGELLQPPADLRDVAPRLLDGGRYEWRPIDRRWRIVVPAPADCGDRCQALARDIGTVWQLTNRDADRVDVLWWCAVEPCSWPANVPAPSTLRLLAPDPAARARLPRSEGVDGTPVYVIDPNGFVVLRYAPGADLGGLRSDLSRLLKLR